MASLVILKNGLTHQSCGGFLSPTGTNLDIPDGCTLSWRDMFRQSPKVEDKVQLLQYGAAEALLVPWNSDDIRMLKVQIESPNWEDMHQLIQHVMAYTGGHVRYLGEQGPNDSSFVRGVKNDVRRFYREIRTRITAFRKRIGFRIAT